MPTIKLNPDEVIAIFNSPGSYRSIALQFNVCHGTVEQIKKRRIWNSITGEMESVDPRTPRLTRQ